MTIPRTSYDDPALVTDLVWKPRAVRNGNQRGALVGTLWGVPVTGKDVGRGTAFQFRMLTGEIHTVWWNGSMWGDAPAFLDVDTNEPVWRNHLAVAWFARLSEVNEKESVR